MIRAAFIALALALAFAATGFYLVFTSSYEDVSKLAQLDRSARVTIQGSPVNMGIGTMVLLIGGEEYLVELRGYYGVAKPVDGEGREYTVFILSGSDGFKVAALYDAKEFTARYGGSPIFEDTVVVDGVYKPSEKIVMLGGEATELPVLEVNAILKGCHASYDGEKAVVVN